MKKIVAVVLALSMFLFGSSLTAFAAEEVSISLKKEDMLRGAMAFKTMVYNKDDGSIVSDGSNISFPLPNTVTSGGTVTVTIKGSCDSDFRVWLIDANEVTVSNQYKMSENGFTSGAFEKTIVLTHDGVGPDATELFFKAPTFDGKIQNLNLTYIGVTEGDASAATDAAATEDAAATDTAAAETTDAAATDTAAAPKAGVTSNVAAYLALMAIATVGFVATKKKVFNK
jgi:hypothetical protein